MSPRILVWDIENSPGLGDIWDLWDQNVSLAQLRDVSKVICFAAKWVGADEVHYYSDFHNGHDATIAAAWTLLDEADAVVSYNGRKHDTPHVMREILLSGGSAPSPYIEVDLYRIVKARFKFMSYKLQHIAEQLGLGSKMEHEGHELWVKCMSGDREAWDTMRAYNEQDVHLTEAVYLRLREGGWITPSAHPNMALYGAAENTCPRCGSPTLIKRGQKAVGLGVYQQYRCSGCGGWSRSGKSLQRVDLRPVV